MGSKGCAGREGSSVREGEGEWDTAAGLVALRLRKTALDKRLAAKTRAWSSTRYFGNGLRQWRQPLSAPPTPISPENAKSRGCVTYVTRPLPLPTSPYRFASSSVISSQVTPLSAINTIMW